jgi:predicted acylesterase/phospholipase RssA
MVNDAGEAVLMSRPKAECDLVMKGGITSGVLYPTALYAVGQRYRIRGIGGASAGAIGAALGAAAEFGRSGGGFERLRRLPDELGEGKLARLFQPQRSTRQLLPLMLAATGHERPAAPGDSGERRSKVLPVFKALFKAFPLACVLGVVPGVALVVVGVLELTWPGWLLIVCGVVVVFLGVAVAVVLRLWRKLTVDVPNNLFGICRGTAGGSGGPGFTDWLADAIDRVAGLDAPARPLRFGNLWTGSDGATDIPPEERTIDLRMITTCLSEGRPYEMPWDAHRFFYDPSLWRTLFPAHVVDALEAAPTTPSRSLGEDGEGTVDEESAELAVWQWEEQLAAAHTPTLRRLPSGEHLPVIVATRMSLSFPLLISAVPLWVIDRRAESTKQTLVALREALREGTALPTSGLVFRQAWFTDGGFCSNFPVQMFDAAMPSRPTFAINLGRFSAGHEPVADERGNVEWARSNSSGLLPSFSELSTEGVVALGEFASAALNTARNWSDNTQLDQPGYRDRIVRILQTKEEGGLNLFMDATTLTRLGERGAAAGKVITEQFLEPRYPPSQPRANGWDNHRWVRYRALLSTLPAWLDSYRRGMAAFDLDPEAPPSYRLSAPARELAGQVQTRLDDLAAMLGSADADIIADLTAAPRPLGAIRRVPQI